MKSIKYLFTLLLLVASAQTAYANDKRPVHKVEKGNLRFGLQLAKHLIKTQEESFICSPFSVSNTLAMTSFLATGETFEELTNVLHLPKDLNAIDRGFLDLNTSLTSGMATGSEPVHLSPCHALFAQDGLIFPQLQTKRLHFWQGGIHFVDFKNQTEEARETINSFVAEQTLEQIQNFLPVGSLSEKTRLCFLSTLYVRAPWKYPFHPDDTYEGFFLGEKEMVQTASFMTCTKALSFAKGDNFSVVALPLADSVSTETRLSLLFLLPDRGYTLESVDLGCINKLKFAEKVVHVQLPKFSLNSFLSLKEPLQALGLQAPFNQEQGFPAIHPEESSLVLEDVLQHSVFSIDEEGILGASATAASLGITCHLDTEEELLFDRPFLFALFDHTTKSLLFVGKVTTLR